MNGFATERSHSAGFTPLDARSWGCDPTQVGLQRPGEFAPCVAAARRDVLSLRFGDAFCEQILLFARRGTVQELSALLTRLNLATRQYHADVDDAWLALASPTVGLADYTGVLVRSYGLIAPFESACKYTPGLSRFVDFRYFLRAGLIAQDLLALGLTPHQVANLVTCPSVTMFQSVPEALGWLYVIERSTLLHDGVRRHLLKQLPHVANACAYLAAYEAHVGDHWAAVGRILDQAAGHDPDVEQQVVDAALRSFAICRDWLRNAKNDNRHTG